MNPFESVNQMPPLHPQQVAALALMLSAAGATEQWYSMFVPVASVVGVTQFAMQDEFERVTTQVAAAAPLQR